MFTVIEYAKISQDVYGRPYTINTLEFNYQVQHPNI